MVNKRVDDSPLIFPAYGTQCFKNCTDLGRTEVLHQGMDPSHPSNISHNVFVRGVGPIDNNRSLIQKLASVEGAKVNFSDSDLGSLAVDCSENQITRVFQALVR